MIILTKVFVLLAVILALLVLLDDNRPPRGMA